MATPSHRGHRFRGFVNESRDDGDGMILSLDVESWTDEVKGQSNHRKVCESESVSESRTFLLSSASSVQGGILSCLDSGSGMETIVKDSYYRVVKDNYLPISSFLSL